MTPKQTYSILILLVITIVASACQFNISRNGDGTLTVDTSISQEQLQSEISSAIADPLVKELTVSLQSGYILVSGERQRLNNTSKTDALNFRLDLGASNGQLRSTISEAQLDGKPIEQGRVDNWNQTIANRIQNFGQKRSNATLQTVSVTPSGVSMTWLVTRQ